MDNEVIVELLGEGGSRALYGARMDDRWLFAMEFIARTDPPATTTGRTPVDSWEDALALLDAYSGWFNLVPHQLHPEFKDALLRAVIERTSSESSTDAVSRWKEALARESDVREPAVVSGPIHASDAWLYDEVDDIEPSDAEIELLREALRRVGTDEATIDRMAPRKIRGLD